MRQRWRVLGLSWRIELSVTQTRLGFLIRLPDRSRDITLEQDSDTDLCACLEEVPVLFMNVFTELDLFFLMFCERLQVG